MQTKILPKTLPRRAASCILAALLVFTMAPAGAFAAARQAYADDGGAITAAALQQGSPSESSKTASGTQGDLVVQAAAADTSWYGDGSASTFTLTKGEASLRGLAQLVNGGVTFEGKTVTLGAGFIVMNALDPIGTAAHPFQGTFDGGCTDVASLQGQSIVERVITQASNPFIQNLELNTNGLLSNIGLFGYAGDKATIKNLRLLGGKVTVSNAAAGKRITDVGAIAGHLGGSLQNCYSTTPVTVQNNGSVPTTAGKKSEDQCTIARVGGLVGSLGGDMSACARADGALSISSTSDVSDNVPYIAAFVGGLAGLQGDESNAGKVPATTNCSNAAPITFDIGGAGGVDRFGQQTYSKSAMVGGIVGYAMGDVADCKNTAAIQTGVVSSGKVQAGWGAVTVGGIVGSLRGPTIAEAASATGVTGTNETDPGYDVWTKSKGATKPAVVAIERCTNTGAVTGLSTIGGIAGSTGAFTKVQACSNTAKIEGTRWNKPCPAGIVGISNGDIAYCYNQGNCISTTGGGYYASGITALLTTYNTASTADNLLMDVPEMYGCYVTGAIGGADSGYRTAVLAGENDGFIHDNCFLPDLTVDKGTDEAVFGDKEKHSVLVTDGQNRGTLKENHEVTAAEMKTSLAVSYLNKPNARKSDWSLFYAPVQGQFPVLNWQGTTTNSPVQLSSVATDISAVEAPSYSAAYAPVPQVKLTTSGAVLYQDADYKVVVDASAKTVGAAYEAAIVGINGYTGELSQKASYSIRKADISTCTVSAAPAVFNWKQQAPSSITVRDDAGNVIDSSEYTFRTLPNSDGSTKAVNGKYYDYINAHGTSYRYDVEVTAAESSPNFTGSTTQAAFRIGWASLMYSPDNDGRTDIPESAKLGNVVYGGQEWDIAKALKTKGFVKIKYTGDTIKPTFKSVTYLGKDMRNGTGKPYYYYPLDYDYLYVYGNPNPELGGSSVEGACVNVTGSDETSLACMTVRFSPGGNFDNYTNVFFEITPASMASDVKVSGIASSYAYTGAAVKPAAVLTYNGKTLAEGSDYTATYKNNVAAGTAQVTFTGKGNYSGSVTRTFKVERGNLASASVSVAGQTYTGAALTPAVVVKLGSATLKSGSDYTVAYKNNVNAGTASVVVTGAGNYVGSATGTFKIAPVNLAKATFSEGGAYTGKAKVPIVSLGGKKLVAGKDYSIAYKNAQGKTLAASQVKGAATYKVVVKGTGNYAGTANGTFTIAKAKNTMKAKAKAVKLKKSKLAKKKQVLKKSKAFKITSAKGKVTFKKASTSKKLKKFKVAKKTGKITVPKGTKKGTYKMKVKVTAAGNANYKKISKTVTVKITVK